MMHGTIKLKLKKKKKTFKDLGFDAKSQAYKPYSLDLAVETVYRDLQITVFISSVNRTRWISLVFHRKAWIFLAKLRNDVIWKTGRASCPREKLLTSCHPDSSFLSLSHLPDSRRSYIQAVSQSWVVAMCQLRSTLRMPQQHFVCRMRWDKEFLFGVSDDAVRCQDCIAPEMGEWIRNTSWTGRRGVTEMPWEKPVPVLPSPVQIPHRLTSACIWASETRCRRMTVPRYGATWNIIMNNRYVHNWT